MISGMIVSKLSKFNSNEGSVLHGLKRSEKDFSGFGEVYFSTIKFGKIKGWRSHRKMTMNLIVPRGKVHFVFYDDREDSSTFNEYYQVITSSLENYSRITVPPLVWMSFKGLDKEPSIVANVASIEHSLEEVKRRELKEFKFDWSKN